MSHQTAVTAEEASAIARIVPRFCKWMARFLPEGTKVLNFRTGAITSNSEGEKELLWRLPPYGNSCQHTVKPWVNCMSALAFLSGGLWQLGHAYFNPSWGNWGIKIIAWIFLGQTGAETKVHRTSLLPTFHLIFILFFLFPPPRLLFHSCTSPWNTGW